MGGSSIICDVWLDDCLDEITMTLPLSFSCDSYTADWETGEITFAYSSRLENGTEYHFTETLTVPLPEDKSRTLHPAIERMCEMIHMTLGVSYFKMFGPTVITHPYTFSSEQVAYWELLYTHGLGEYYYTNQLDYRGKVRVEGRVGDVQSVELHSSQKALVLHGGGKDSIVSVEVIKKAGIEFDLFAVNHSGIQKGVADVMHKPIYTIVRKIDQQLIDMSKAGEVYTGHVPISAVYATLAMLYALLHGYTYVVTSNEESAVYGNISYLDMIVNHQWSKSQVFESATRAYLSSICGNSLDFFSLLRPLYEIRIAQLFSKFSEYFEVFSSSNHNFTISSDGKSQRWDVEFSKGKVEFVWALLSAFLSKEDMLRTFQIDVFSREDRLPIFQQLLGEKDVKPLDCVGTPEETIVALYLCYNRGEWNDTPIMMYFIHEVLPKHKDAIDSYTSYVMEWGDDSHIPHHFTNALRDMLATV